MSQRRRLAIPLATFLVVLALGIYRQPAIGSGDLTIPLCAADRLLRGIDPYSCNTFAFGRFWPSNPLTTVAFVSAFLPFQPYAAQVIFALNSALLAFAVTEKGAWWRLIVFLSPSFFLDSTYLQWTPLMLAAYYLPNILPLTLIKPHLAIPVILSKLNCWRLVGIAVFGLLTLVIDPTWPLRWWPQAQSFDGYIPLLRFPFLAFALLAWKDERVRLFALMTPVPQRGIPDLLLLWALPRSPKEMLLFTVWSWNASMLIPVQEFKDLFGFYLPALALVLYPMIDAKLRVWAAAAPALKILWMGRYKS